MRSPTAGWFIPLMAHVGISSAPCHFLEGWWHPDGRIQCYSNAFLSRNGLKMCHLNDAILYYILAKTKVIGLLGVSKLIFSTFGCVRPLPHSLLAFCCQSPGPSKFSAPPRSAWSDSWLDTNSGCKRQHSCGRSWSSVPWGVPCPSMIRKCAWSFSGDYCCLLGIKLVGRAPQARGFLRISRFTPKNHSFVVGVKRQILGFAPPVVGEYSEQRAAKVGFYRLQLWGHNRAETCNMFLVSEQFPNFPGACVLLASGGSHKKNLSDDKW